MDNVFMADKNLMVDVINTLKTIHPLDYDSMDKLVGCVSVLEIAMNPPPSIEETKTEEIDPSNLEEVKLNG